MNDSKLYDPLNNPRTRFENDPSYRALVQAMEAQIHRAEFTPSEIREAAIFACIRYEQHNLRGIVIPKSQTDVIDGLKAIDAFVNGRGDPI